MPPFLKLCESSEFLLRLLLHLYCLRMLRSTTIPQIIPSTTIPQLTHVTKKLFTNYSVFYHLISYIILYSQFCYVSRFNMNIRALIAIKKLRTHRDVVFILYSFISITQQTFFPGRGWCYSLRYISKP